MIKPASFPNKDPQAVLDYRFDWAAQRNNTGSSDWLQPDETISTYEVTIPTGLTKVTDNKDITNTSVIVWISGGTVDMDYNISCKIVTSSGRTDVRTIVLPVRLR